MALPLLTGRDCKSSRVGQHAAIGTAKTRSTATRLKDPASEPFGSARCYWNG